MWEHDKDLVRSSLDIAVINIEQNRKAMLASKHKQGVISLISSRSKNWTCSGTEVEKHPAAFVCTVISAIISRREVRDV